MALAALVSKQKGRRLLKNLIKEDLGEVREIPPVKEGDYIRASSMYRVCAREEVIASLTGFIRKDEISPDLKLIFEHGHALHHQLQNSILPDLGVLVGQWQCQWCMKKHGGWVDGIPKERTLIHRPAKCKRCGKSNFLYNELHFKDTGLRIDGHPDGFLQLEGMPGLGVLEAKSIGMRGGLDVRKAPNIGHVIQAQTYMMLTGLRWAKILYWQKAQNGLDALVEHTVEYDQETVDGIRELIQSIWRGLRLGVLPDRICETDDCKRAKECPLVETCFQHEKTIKVEESPSS